MAKKTVKAVVKLYIPAGQASPAPPVGPSLSPYGVAIMNFCKEFNEKTRDRAGDIIPVVVTIYTDRTYTMELKTPPVSFLIKKMLGLEKGAADPKRQKVGKLTRAQVEEIARMKFRDLNVKDLSGAIRVIEGTARSMGVEVEQE
ncbi:MAG: 50S ribosomal protein L11 [bacterium JZ-2024 1]